MRLCGNVYALENFQCFALKCFNCEYTTNMWTSFQMHAKYCLVKQNLEFYEEKSSNALDELKLEDAAIKTSVSIEKIKGEVDAASVRMYEEHIEECGDDEFDLIEHEKQDYIALKEEQEFLDEEQHLVDTFIADDTMDNGYEDDDVAAIVESAGVAVVDDENENVEILEEFILSDSEWTAEADADSDNNNDSCLDSDATVNYELGNVNDDFKQESDKKFIISFYRKDDTTAFLIELYKQQRCLWDTNDENFGHELLQSNAYQTIAAEIYKKYKIQLKESKIKEFISKIRYQYEETRQLYTSNPKSNLLKSLAIMHYKRCMFLGEIDLPEKHAKDEANKAKRLTTKDKNFTTKFKIFAICTEDYIDALIDLYKQFPELYDRNHVHYLNNRIRRKAQAQIIEELNSQHGGNCCGADMTQEELIAYLTSLRHWYYSMREKLKNADADCPPPPALNEKEQYFYEKCQFIPDYVKQTTRTCEHCGAFFKSLTKFECHMWEKHKIGEPNIFRCEQCNRGFPKPTSLTIHIQRHHTAKNYECEFCKRRFAIKADWQLHLRVHTNEKPYVCEQCGKAFRLRNQLGNHVTTMHLRKRDFKCSMCPKAFYLKVHLKDHIKSHLDIRDKICNVCGKGFTNTHSLGRHRQIHSEIKKFGCKLCDARFHQFVGLSSHMKRTHGIFKNKAKE